VRLCEQFSVAQGNALASSLDAFASDMDVFFLLWAASLVIFMHAGFAMLSAGAVRTKSTTNILLCIVLDLAMCALAWWIAGYAFAYGGGGQFIGAEEFFVGRGIEDLYIDWFFQFAFAATAATIVSGAICERATFESYMSYSFYLSFWIYPVTVHWVWGGGFLTLNGDDPVAGVGALDFAGDGPVHLVGGVAGFVGSWIIGPRMGRFRDGKPISMPGHSTPLAVLGTFILWVGWFGFNPGSALSIIGSAQLAERAAINTILSSATGGLASLLWTTYRRPGRDWDIIAACNGVLAGLVSITAGCPAVQTWAALVIGLIGGTWYVYVSWFVVNVAKVDDPLDAVAVHAGCGIWGLIAVGFFAKTEFVQQVAGFEDVDDRDYSGIFYGGNGKLLGAQVTEIIVITLWVAAFIAPYFLFLRKMNWLRISPNAEEIGIDESSHGGSAYPEIYSSSSRNLDVDDDEETGTKKELQKPDPLAKSKQIQQQ